MSTPQPNRQRALREIAGFAVGLLLMFVVTSAINEHRNEVCIVNGFGNELCGDSAIAYCDLLAENGSVAAESDACLSVRTN